MRINFNQGRQPASLLGKVLAAIVGVLTLAAALMFSLVFVVVLAVAGLCVWGYFWWKTRELRRQIKDQMQTPPFGQQSAEPAGEGEIIEGEAVRVVDEKNQISG
jgi:hypothetical protein